MRVLKGFDVSQYPGNDTMRELKQYFDFCNLYLAPAPSHRDAGWMQSRNFLGSIGYYIAAIYVGQQVIGPGSHKVNAAQGKTDGHDCVNLMLTAGFKPGDPVYLDLENGPPFTDDQRAYVDAWVAEVTGGGFRPGVYASWRFITEFDSKTILRWMFKVPTTKTTTAELPKDINAAPAPLPQSVAIQYRQNVEIHWGARKLLVDLDTAMDFALVPPIKVTGIA